VQVVDTSSSDELTVFSNFVVYSNRRDSTGEIFAGRRTDVLRRSNTSWQVASRHILLDQTVLLTDSLSILF